MRVPRPKSRGSLAVAMALLALGAVPQLAWADQNGAAGFDQIDPSISEHQPELSPLMDMPPDQGFVTQLLLMQGHLDACRTLFDAGIRNQAFAHCVHPLDELYDDLALQLDDRGLPGFGAELRAVVEVLRANDSPAEFAAAAGRATAAIDAALVGVDESARNAPDFVVAVVTGLLRAAERDYQASLADGQVANVIEYQDSRAFLGRARRLVEAGRASLEAKDATAFAELQKQIDDLGRLLPLQPPTAAAIGPDQVVAIVDRVSALQTHFR